MYNQKHISKKEHYSYLSKQLQNPNFVNWIICSDSQNIGYVRILDNDVSIMIEEKFHSKGIGTNALKLMESEAKKLKIKKLVGRIFVNNKKSEKIFVKNKYKLKMFWYEKEI